MYKIMLCCAGGMSTSLLVTKMKNAAENKGIEAKIWAVGATNAKVEGQDADIVMLGPQVGYLKGQITKELPGKPIVTIDMRSYGRMDGEKVLADALEVLEK